MYQLKVTQQNSIIALYKQGWSKRRIARELGVDRLTVRRYVGAADSKSPAPQTGSEAVGDSKSPASPHTGTEAEISKSPTPQTGSQAELSKSPTHPHTGSVVVKVTGPGSLCEPWKERIESGLAAGLSMQRIYQDLLAEQQFRGSYHSVRRYVRRLEKSQELPFRRLEVEPGQEAQVDFGQGAWVVEPTGKRRRPHLFRIVLSRSRKAYSEVVWRQTTENFIRCLENAFRYFGGVTKTVVIDNLRAAVSRADWFEPQIHPKLEEFCRHYGTVILPTKPAMPRHKGKIESGVKYAQNNALAGRQFDSLNAQNSYLSGWENHTADKRIHGTTKQQVAQVFDQIEKPRLLPLPSGLFPVFEEAPRMVHRDGHVELARAYYSVPPEYVGRKVWARWESRVVRIYNQRWEQIALHTRHQPGQFATDPNHIHDHKRALIERGADWLLDRARLIGKYCGTWAEQMFAQRGPYSIRSLHGLLALAEKHPVAALEGVCRQAIEHGAWRLRDLRALLDRQPVEQLTFLEKHPLIRDLEAYANIVPVCFNPQHQNQKENQQNEPIQH